MVMLGKMSVGVRRGRRDAEDQDQQRHDDEGVRAPKRELDYADHGRLPRVKKTSIDLITGNLRPPGEWLLAPSVSRHDARWRPARRDRRRHAEWLHWKK